MTLQKDERRGRFGRVTPGACELCSGKGGSEQSGQVNTFIFNWIGVPRLLTGSEFQQDPKTSPESAGHI